MPVFGIYPRDDGQALPTLTATLTSDSTQAAQNKSPGHPDSLSPGVIGTISVVLLLIAIYVVTTVVLHRLWCMNPRCKACRILRCKRWKPQKGRNWEKRLSSLPSFSVMSFDYIPGSPEKSAFSIRDSSPPDRHFRPDGEGDTTSVTQPGDKPRYFTTSGSIVSDVVLITTPRTEPLAAACSLVPTSLEPAATPNQEQKEPVERSAGGESHPPLAFDSARLSTTGPRNSQASGLLSIITLPSFIVNDRPRPYSSSARARTESPVQPNNYDHKRPSIFGQRLSGAESILPLSLANSENTGGKTSRPTSGSLRIITSVFRRSGSTASSVRSCSPSSRRSSRRSLGRPNLSPGSEDEAAIQWKRLPPLPLAQGICTAQSPQSRTGSGVEEFSTERLPSCRESDPKSPIFLASHIPLPPSPSTLASSVSSINYASPSFEDIPPTNGFITPYASYPPLPPSIPPSPGQFSYPPTPTLPTDSRISIRCIGRIERSLSRWAPPAAHPERRVGLG